MSKTSQWGLMAGLVAFGYALGASGVLTPSFLAAQNTKAALRQIVSDDAAAKIRAANDALRAAQETLMAEQKLVPATSNLNAFAILSGGVNAVEDLEANRGVDPETFAALYAGLAEDAVRAKLGNDSEGRLTYDGKVIRLYPVSRLKAMFETRDIILGVKTAK